MELGGSEKRREPYRLRAEGIRMAPPARGEVLEEGERLVGTFYLPAHEPRDVKYHVGRRTITLWSRKPGTEFQTILVLPRWVRPETFILRHNNGLYEFVLEDGPVPETVQR